MVSLIEKCNYKPGDHHWVKTILQFCSVYKARSRYARVITTTSIGFLNRVDLLDSVCNHYLMRVNILNNRAIINIIILRNESSYNLYNSRVEFVNSLTANCAFPPASTHPITTSDWGIIPLGDSPKPTHPVVLTRTAKVMFCASLSKVQ